MKCYIPSFLLHSSPVLTFVSGESPGWYEPSGLYVMHGWMPPLVACLGSGPTEVSIKSDTIFCANANDFRSVEFRGHKLSGTLTKLEFESVL